MMTVMMLQIMMISVMTMTMGLWRGHDYTLQIFWTVTPSQVNVGDLSIKYPSSNKGCLVQ